MTTPWNASPLSGSDADRLGDAWDALVAGRRSTPDADADLLALAGLLAAEAAPPRPNPSFRTSLRETLMHARVAPTPALALVAGPLPPLGRSAAVGPAAPSSRPAPGRLRATGMRWAATAASITLLLATVSGGYLASRSAQDSGPTGVPGLAQASPEAGDEWVDGCPGRPYFPCGIDPEIGRTFFSGSHFPSESTSGTNVTMLGWQVQPGQTATWDPADPQIVPGVAVDIVVSGAYAATFSAPVQVTYADPLGGSSYETLGAGEVVELAEGDAVAFAQGTRLEVANRLTTRPLVFKSIVVHGEVEEGTTAPGSGQVIEGNPMGGGATYQMDGTGTIPMPIREYPRQEFGVALTYSQIYPQFPLPTTVGDSSVILGPVDPTDFTYPEITPEEGTEGYIVWLVIPKG